MKRFTGIHDVVWLIGPVTLFVGCAATSTDSYSISGGSTAASEFFTCEEVFEGPGDGVAFKNKGSMFRIRENGADSRPSATVTSVALWRGQKGKVGKPELSKLDEGETSDYGEPGNPRGQTFISCDNCCQTAQWEVLAPGRWKVQWYLNGTAAGCSEFVVR